MAGPRKSVTSDLPEERLAGNAYEHYGNQLHQFLMRRLPCAQDAGDLMQEIFLRLLRLRRRELIRNPQAYLYGIASRVIRDYRLRMKSEKILFDSEIAQQRAEYPEHLAPDALPDGLSLERQLEQALKLLSPVHLQIFLLDRCSGLSQTEIAEKLGLSPHTVKKYAVQALALVRLRCMPAEDQKAEG